MLDAFQGSFQLKYTLLLEKDKNIANTDNPEKNGLLLSLWQNNLFFFFHSNLLIHFNLFIGVVRKKKKETLHIGIYDPLLPVMRLLSVLLTVFVQSFKVYEEPFRNL